MTRILCYFSIVLLFLFSLHNFCSLKLQVPQYLLDQRNDYKVDSFNKNDTSYHLDVAFNFDEELEEDPNNYLVKKASVHLNSLGSNIMHITIKDSDHERFEVFDFNPDFSKENELDSSSEMKFFFEESPFSFGIMDAENNTILSFAQKCLQFFDKYMKIDVRLFSQKISGLGEHIVDFWLPEG